MVCRPDLPLCKRKEKSEDAPCFNVNKIGSIFPLKIRGPFSIPPLKIRGPFSIPPLKIRGPFSIPPLKIRGGQGEL
jgi:hypothetical protein